MDTHPTRTATINGARLRYSVRGEGEPVLLVHGGVADVFLPLLMERQLSERYRLIFYYRRGYGASTSPTTSVDIPAQAADCRALLDHLGVPEAHVVGHSFGAAVALQLALDSPDRVRSLALLEAALPAVLGSSPEFGAAMEQTFALYQAGDLPGALDAFLRAALGPEYRPVLDRVLPPGSFERAAPAIETLLRNDVPALQAWTFTPETAARITHPALLVVGSDSHPLFHEIHRQMQVLLPAADVFELPAATHLLMAMNARDTATALAAFFGRYPLEPKAYALPEA